MGASQPARNDRFSACGLVPGVPLRLEVSVGNHVECLATRVEEVGPNTMAILLPMVRRQARRLATGTLVHAEYIFRNRRCRFVTEVAGHSDDGLHEILRLPPAIDTIERRSHFRLQTALRPQALFRLVLGPDDIPGDETAFDDCTIVDLSEGGACLSSRVPLHDGERLGIVFTLPGVGEINARMRVLSVDEPAHGKLNRRAHCIFTDIRLSDRDRIARYLMRRQLEMRRRGQL
ncbi:MAG: PilZ domain-containing protein [Thermoflexaceae bacterium]|nr:PilZ domain-containing protein [Thermoflexaceae bacterium]